MISDERHHQRLRTLEYAHREAWYIGDKADACSPESIKDVQAWADELFTTNEVLRRVDTRVIVRPGFFDPHEHYLYRAIRDQAAWELWEDMTPAERAADVERSCAESSTSNSHQACAASQRPSHPRWMSTRFHESRSMTGHKR